MLDNKLFTEGMVRLANIFKKEDMSKMFLDDYYKAFSELSNPQFIRAVEYLIKSHKSAFFPIPGQFFEAVEATREMVQVTPRSNQLMEKGVPCPPEVKKQIEEIMERIKRKGMK